LDKSLIIIQPILTSYRKRLIVDMTKYFNRVTVFANLHPGDGYKSDIDGSFTKIHTPIIGVPKKLYYQKGISQSVIKTKPTAIFMTADFRAINYWSVLILANILRIPVFSHGQGLYNKTKPNILIKSMFYIAVKYSRSYVCYTESVFKSLSNIGLNEQKLYVMRNTIVNTSIVYPSDKLNTIHRLFYIGRLREGCSLDLLFKSLMKLNSDRIKIGLDIIGDGSHRSKYESLAKTTELDIKFYGAIYDDESISNISKNCTIGVYPGDAGLSIIHYMSLSLVPIVHSDLSKHMGPEPSYIQNGVNGLTFIRNDYLDLVKVIRTLLGNDSLNRKISKSAFNTYTSLSSPTMADSLFYCMAPHLSL
jgi:glycosyltransferase involved in cell wall biosynthesis